MADEDRNPDRYRIGEQIPGLSGEERLQERERVIAVATRAFGDTARIEIAEAPRSYAGRVLATTDHHVIQEHGGRSGVAIAHDRRALSLGGDLTGKEVEISYPHGRAGLVRQDLSETDRALIRFERAARDEYDGIVDREPRLADGIRVRELHARVEALAEARFRTGKLDSPLAQDVVLARLERGALNEADYAGRQGDRSHEVFLREKAGAFAEARGVLEQIRDREISETVRQVDRSVVREGREARADQGPELGDR